MKLWVTGDSEISFSKTPILVPNHSSFLFLPRLCLYFLSRLEFNCRLYLRTDSSERDPPQTRVRAPLWWEKERALEGHRSPGPLFFWNPRRPQMKEVQGGQQVRHPLARLSVDLTVSAGHPNRCSMASVGGTSKRCLGF